MKADFLRLDQTLAQLRSKTTPRARRTLAATLAKMLQQENQQRIAAQTDPAGARFAPRQRNYPGYPGKTGGMFQQLRRDRFLRASATPVLARAGFAGNVARIAAVHHFGLQEKNRRQKTVDYPARPLLGINARDQAQILAAIAAFLGAAKD